MTVDRRSRRGRCRQKYPGSKCMWRVCDRQAAEPAPGRLVYSAPSTQPRIPRYVNATLPRPFHSALCPRREVCTRRILSTETVLTIVTLEHSVATTPSTPGHTNGTL